MGFPSLVICTRNRASRLPKVFEAIAAMEGVERAEIVVIDSCSTDDTRACLDRIATSGKLNMKVFTADKPGVGYALRIALPETSGDPLIFTDDDCIPDKHFIRNMIEVFKDPSIGFAAGRIELYNHEDYPITIRTDTQREYYEPGKYIEAGLVQGANMAFRRRALLDAGGFDIRFGPGGRFRGGADLEAVTRLSGLGWRGGYFPEPLIYHDHGRRKPEEIASLERRYDYSRGAVKAKRLLDRRTRHEYLRHCYWTWRLHLRTNPGKLLRELRGAAHVVLDELLLRRFRD